MCLWTVLSAQTTFCPTDTVDFKVVFRQSKWNIDRDFGNNSVVLDSIDRIFSVLHKDTEYRLRHVSIVGGASPEGSLRFNRFLSEQRAKALFDHMSRYGLLRDEEKSFTFLGRDWEGVLRLAEVDKSLPYRDETIALLRDIADEKRQTGEEPARGLQRLKTLRYGKPYLYLYGKVFPAVRTSRLEISYDRMQSNVARLRLDEITPPYSVLTGLLPPYYKIADTDTAVVSSCSSFYMDLRTNMLFDALALPNVGVEFYVGHDISIGGNIVYAWWSNNGRHRYWRGYGGELFARYWFGSAAQLKPLTGHHLGIYGQMYTYDFEWGGKGEMGGQPGGNIWDKAQWGVGIEYGYSLPISRRINIDFTIGLGYTTGTYHTYRPIDDHYVWQETKRRKWFGPTKAEISFVWLIGCDNYNRPKAKKGERR